jgi:hypothetical protein
VIEQAFARFENVIAGKFAADFVQKLHPGVPRAPSVAASVPLGKRSVKTRK